MESGRTRKKLSGSFFPIMKSCNHFLWKIKLRSCFCWKNRRRQRRQRRQQHQQQRLRRWWRQRQRQRFWQWQRQRQWRRQQRRQQQRLQRLQRGLAGLFFILILILHATLAFISWLARAPLEMEQAQIFCTSQARVLKVEPKRARAYWKLQLANLGFLYQTY